MLSVKLIAAAMLSMQPAEIAPVLPELMVENDAPRIQFALSRDTPKIVPCKGVLMREQDCPELERGTTS